MMTGNDTRRTSYLKVAFNYLRLHNVHMVTYIRVREMTQRDYI